MGSRERVLKADALGRVVRVERPSGEVLLARLAVGGSLPASGMVARLLLRRERRALEHARGLEGIPRLVEDAEVLAGLCSKTPGLKRKSLGLRGFLDGEPLHRARALPADFFEHLAALVRALHARGVCHNDLHKEQNIIVRVDGRPGLIDFQLASVHVTAGRRFRSRAADDLRHVEKHRLRYARAGRPKRPEERSSVALPKRSATAGIWRRTGKPLYNFITRRILARSDGEERRPSSGPWPAITAALGELDSGQSDPCDSSPRERVPQAAQHPRSS